MTQANGDDATGVNALPRLRRPLLAWYDRHARVLPWRGAGATPYRVLVSEFMLQQTQVRVVVPYFLRFMQAFPTLADLAAADEGRVLSLWQGLGYYARARRLHALAREVVTRHGGVLPADVDALRALPGVGRYTAGAVASIAFRVAAPILDGNVTRVLCRVFGERGDPATPAVNRRLWALAEAVVDPERPGDFNSALMELGATVCVPPPAAPLCLVCPLREMCVARLGGFERDVPPPKKRVATPDVVRVVWRVRDDAGRVVMEQRPPAGRWAGMWQMPTRPEGVAPPLQMMKVVPAGQVSHRLTHRAYTFRVFDATCVGAVPPPLRWADEAELAALPVSRPQRRALALPYA